MDVCSWSHKAVIAQANTATRPTIGDCCCRLIKALLTNNSLRGVVMLCLHCFSHSQPRHYERTIIMSIKINVGVNKKIGLPDYGSAGGHCNIEIEADNSILDNPDQFFTRLLKL